MVTYGAYILYVNTVRTMVTYYYTYILNVHTIRTYYTYIRCKLWSHTVHTCGSGQPKGTLKKKRNAPYTHTLGAPKIMPILGLRVHTLKNSSAPLQCKQITMQTKNYKQLTQCKQLQCKQKSSRPITNTTIMTHDS